MLNSFRPGYGCQTDLTLENDSLSLTQWFSDNKMQANPEKFQAIAIGSKTHKADISFDLSGN